MSAISNIRYLKQLLLGAVVLTLIVGPFQPLIAQADTPSATNPAAYNGTANADGTATPASQGFGNLNSNLAPANSSPVNAAGQVVTNTNTNTGSGTPGTGAPECNWFSNWSLCITNVVYVFTVGIGSGFAYVAAYFFDLAVNLSLNGPIYALTFISTGWTTARDLANMAFLFILIYIAYTIILEADTHGTMSLLAGVIVIALLVNFSFFFTRIVIDAGNILSIQFYNSITAPSVQSSAQTSNVAYTAGAAASIVGASTQTKDLTASIMGMLQLQNLFNTNSFQNFYAPKDGTVAPGFLVVVVTLSFLYIAAGIMFYLITVMFVTAGVKFLMRIVVLWFLIIASPLAFVARAVPNFKKYFDTWREMLISHAFYPVAFMFIFLILTNFTNQMGNCTSSGGSSSQSCLINDIFTSLPANSSGNAFVVIGIAIANVAIRMGFVIAILYLGMKASDKISVMGADFAKSAGGWVGSKYMGAMGAAGRNTFGFAGYKLGQTNAMQTWSRVDPLIGRNLFKGFNKLGTANFDARTPLGALGVKTPGKAQKDGYKGQFDARIKRREKEAEQYSNDVSKEQKDKFEKDKKEAQDAYQKDLAAAREKDTAAQEAENKRAHTVAENEVDASKRRESVGVDIVNTTKIQQDAAKAQSEAEQNIKKLEKSIEDLRNQGKIGSPEMSAAIAERKTHEATASTHEAIRLDASTKLSTFLTEQKNINDSIAKRAKELTKKVEQTKVEKAKVEEPISQRKGFASSLESRATNLSRLGFWIPAADKKAADKIRKGKTKAEKLADAAKEYEEEKHKEEHGDEHKEDDKLHAPPVSSPAAPSTPAGGGAGGDHH